MSSLIKKIIQGPKSSTVKMNSRLFTFFVCVLVSVFFWLLMALSKDYSIKITFPVSYINLSKNKVIAGFLPNHIVIIVKAKGFNLLAYQYIKTKEVIVIDLKDAKPHKSKNDFFLLTNSGIEKIASQFSSNILVLKVSPDTIHFTYNKKVSKKVPVKVVQKITFADEYQLTDSIKISPEMIRISGAKDVIDKIDFIETSTLLLNEIDKSVKIKLPIKKTSNMQFVECDKAEVLVSVTVAKFAEASIDLPVQIENLPSKYSIKIFPDNATVKYQVSFDDYKKIKTSDFRVIVDYKTIEKGSDKIKIQLVKVPSFIKSIKLSPEKVEYILRK